MTPIEILRERLTPEQARRLHGDLYEVLVKPPEWRDCYICGKPGSAQSRVYVTPRGYPLCPDCEDRMDNAIERYADMQRRWYKETGTEWLCGFCKTKKGVLSAFNEYFICRSCCEAALDGKVTAGIIS